MVQQHAIIRATLGFSAVLLSALVMPAQANYIDKDLPLTAQRGVLVSVGQAHLSNSQLSEFLENLGYSDLSIEGGKNASAWSVGYRHPVSNHWSADIQYSQQGKTIPTVQATLPSGKTTYQAAKDVVNGMPRRGQGVSALALYHHPLNSKVNLQFGLGAVIWQSQRSATVEGSTYTSKSEGISGMIQLGVSYPITRKIRLETHWQHTFMPREAVDRLGLGVAVGF